MYASQCDRPHIVQLLLSYGADVDLKNDRQQTALDVARNEEIRDMLLNHVSTGYVLK
jgi:hypothetical protein